MRPWDKGGLGMKEVCDYIGIPSGCDQTTLDLFIEDGDGSDRNGGKSGV